MAPLLTTYSFSEWFDSLLFPVCIEGIRELEIARGIRTREETISPAQIQLQPKYCWACGETNKHNAKFCFKCNVAISKEGMLEDKEKEAEAQKEAENTKKEIQVIKDEFGSFKENLAKISNLWETMGQLLEERREMETSIGIKSSSSSIGDFLQYVKELRKELHNS